MPRTYRSDRREAQARVTRRRVLAAATGLFEARGYAATTVRAVAAHAGVAVPTVEAQFGSKPRLLKAAIDVAIAGDDDPVAMLDRDWADRARAAATARAVLAVAAEVLAPAQRRSAGLVLAVFEGASTDPDLASLADQLVGQRRGTATWIVDLVAGKDELRAPRAASIDTLWTLMDPAVFDRVTRRLGWSIDHYRDWFTDSATHLLVADEHPSTRRNTR